MPKQEPDDVTDPRPGAEAPNQRSTAARLAAIEASSGKYEEAFESGYLDRLRDDWPS